MIWSDQFWIPSKIHLPVTRFVSYKTNRLHLAYLRIPKENFINFMVTQTILSLFYGYIVVKRQLKYGEVCQPYF